MKTSAEQLLEIDSMATAVAQAFSLTPKEVFAVMVKALIIPDKVGV